MADITDISWADHTHNQWVGCTRISPACDGCYAANLMDNRMHRVKWGGAGVGIGERDLTSEANRKKPFTWNRRAQRCGKRPFVFGGSLNDPFDNAVPDAWRRTYFRDVIAKTPNLIWLLLTKRPQNIVEMSEDAGGLPENVALGCTAENQTVWDRNIGELINAKATLGPLFAFVSIEPMLGRIQVTSAEVTWSLKKHLAFSRPGHHKFNPIHPRQEWRYKLDWIITGGETNQGEFRARPSNPEWFREIRDDCLATGTAYHHKQNGEYASVSEIEGRGEHYRFPSGATVRRVGKTKAGRLLDGVLHDARPIVGIR